MLAYFAGVLLLVLAGYTMVIAFDWGQAGNSLVDLTYWMHGNPWESALIAVVMLAAAVVLFIIPKPRRYEEGAFRTASKWGEVHVTPEAIKEIVKRSALAVKGVRHVEPQLHPHENQLGITVVTQLDMDAVIPEVSEQLQAQVKLDLEHIAGIGVNEVKVLVRGWETSHQARIK